MPQSRESLGSGYHAAVVRIVKNEWANAPREREREKPVRTA